MDHRLVFAASVLPNRVCARPEVELWADVVATPVGCECSIVDIVMSFNLAMFQRWKVPWPAIARLEWRDDLLVRQVGAYPAWRR